jgi:hypothetical protein
MDWFSATRLDRDRAAFQRSHGGWDATTRAFSDQADTKDADQPA